MSFFVLGCRLPSIPRAEGDSLVKQSCCCLPGVQRERRAPGTVFLVLKHATTRKPDKSSVSRYIGTREVTSFEICPLFHLRVTPGPLTFYNLGDPMNIGVKVLRQTKDGRDYRVL